MKKSNKTEDKKCYYETATDEEKEKMAERAASEAIAEQRKIYERVSHVHCWNQGTPACGQPLEKHKQCCLCDMPYEPKIEGWRENFIDEFGIHFKEKGELQFVLEFIDELLKEQREKRDKEWVEMIKKHPIALTQLQGEIALFRKLDLEQ